jgi:hypothetical protein
VVVEPGVADRNPKQIEIAGDVCAAEMGQKVAIEHATFFA